MTGPPVGTFALVLHSHLPWLAHHGTWPVGEDWLHEAWASSYLPLVAVLEELASEGRQDLVTLGVTPVLAAQLDDPHCLRSMHAWLGLWQLRAHELAADPDPRRRAAAAYEHAASERALSAFETRWLHGGSPPLRRLADAGAVELLGGPATHPFLPLLEPRVTDLALRTGLDDALLRTGRRPAGIWSPECGYSPGLERRFAAAGVGHLPLEQETLVDAGGTTSRGWEVAGSGVVAFARDLSVTNRVWSSRHGYPGGAAYRDFHAQDALGFRRWAVTSPDAPGDAKRPYDPAAAAAMARRDAADLVDAVRRRLADIAAAEGRPGLVVAAYDTELFGHWWHEGPQFLGHLLRLLPAAGVRVTTLQGAVDAGLVGGSVDPGPGSWGAGKDYRVWAGEPVADLATDNAWAQQRLLDVVDRALAPAGAATTRRPDLDQLGREALLLLSSDWAFMITRDSAATYARQRAGEHLDRFSRLADVIDSGDAEAARDLATRLRTADGPFGQVDARTLLAESAADDLVGARRTR